MVDWMALDFRKLYVPFSQTFERLPYAARAFGADIIRRCDREGRVVKVVTSVTVTSVTSLPSQVIDDIVFHVRAHTGEETWIRMAIEALLRDGYLVVEDGWLKIRNYVDAQRSTSAERMAKKRQRESGRQRVHPVSRSAEDSVTSGTVRHSDAGDESDQEERRGEEKDPPKSPNSESVVETVCRAYGEGIRAIVPGPPFVVLDDEADVLLRIVRDDPSLTGKRSEGLAAPIRREAAAYAQARQGDAKFEKGFSPTKFAEWRRTRPPVRGTAAEQKVRESNAVQESFLRGKVAT